MTKIIQNTEKNRSLWNRQIRESTTKIETSFPWKIQTQIAQVLCRKASATRIPGKDHWHQTAVTTFTENGPFQGYTEYTRKTVFDIFPVEIFSYFVSLKLLSSNLTMENYITNEPYQLKVYISTAKKKVFF